MYCIFVNKESIRDIVIYDKFLIFAGNDEIIYIYDKNRK